ncbi:MAG: site-2 protease family protein, partial [Fidelibacterota bacterium]
MGIIHQDPAVQVILLPLIIFALSFHEFAHGWMAYRFGDPTALHQGRLTLNPLAHLDPFGTLVLYLVGFGWAKPVPVNPGYFRRPQTGMAIVGVAGPAVNIVLSVAAALIFRFVVAVHLDIGQAAAQMLVYAVIINIVLATFNMVPIPPLDGSRVIVPFLPREAALAYRQLEPYGFLII